MVGSCGSHLAVGLAWAAVQHLWVMPKDHKGQMVVDGNHNEFVDSHVPRLLQWIDGEGDDTD